MINTFAIERSVADEGIILFDAVLDTNVSVRLAFDTGASHTTIDSNSLLMAGYDISTPIDTISVETSNGMIYVNVIEITHFEAFGIKKECFFIQVYDFVAHGILSEYEGILGLDFLEDAHFCLNLRKNELSIHLDDQ
jgi:predicted aspartyl protease